VKEWHISPAHGLAIRVGGIHLYGISSAATGGLRGCAAGQQGLRIVSSCREPPGRSRWLHEIKHDGHRLTAIIGADGPLRLLP